jgi:SAM-dependent methyltransferase
MEQFYQLLKEHNKNYASHHSDLPEWFLQYTENIPPLYWKTIYQILSNKSKELSIVEIGAGYGDITSLLHYMGYNNIISFERDGDLCAIVVEKVKSLFGYTPLVLNEEYPKQLDFAPDILLQVNCVYVEIIKSKDDYLSYIRNIYEANGIPQMYILEVIDDSYKEINDIFPMYVRLNKTHISQLFPQCAITEYKTYIYPQNKVSKSLYCICR